MADRTRILCMLHAPAGGTVAYQGVTKANTSSVWTKQVPRVDCEPYALCHYSEIGNGDHLEHWPALVGPGNNDERSMGRRSTLRNLHISFPREPWCRSTAFKKRELQSHCWYSRMEVNRERQNESYLLSRVSAQPSGFAYSRCRSTPTA